MQYWLFKSEPQTFSINDLRNRPRQTEHWDGVRNYQARNFIRDKMTVGDLGFFYHSSCDMPGIVGVIEVVSQPYPDHTAFDPDSKYYDPLSTPEKPRWWMVDVKWVEMFPQIITLHQIKQQPALQMMPLVRKGSRLSIMPVTASEWQVILECAAVP
ncbi:MAG TPA: EVE domain-containing protein [Gammaproteobacteria bacterium]|jgi:predicted RNA-binding protein with PUA-like domain|nr:EVE domain-containing protein [Gammaproteobacteria bacterium]